MLVRLVQNMMFDIYVNDESDGSLTRFVLFEKAEQYNTIQYNTIQYNTIRETDKMIMRTLRKKHQVIIVITK